jgi:hypothetical protein
VLFRGRFLLFILALRKDGGAVADQCKSAEQRNQQSCFPFHVREFLSFLE